MKPIVWQNQLNTQAVELKQPVFEIDDTDPIDQQIITALRGIYDPEISVNIYDLGLIYQIDINAEHEVAIQMTLTSPACPVAGQLPAQVESVVGALQPVNSVQVELVWQPPWSREMMSEEARLTLGLL